MKNLTALMALVLIGSGMVDAFHLALSDEGWKIVHLADTRVTGGCPTR